MIGREAASVAAGACRGQHPNYTDHAQNEEIDMHGRLRKGRAVQ